MGLAFKLGTDDLREAPGVDLVRVFVEESAAVWVCDPMAKPAKGTDLPSSVEMADDLASCAQGAQALVIMTEWPEIVEADWAELAPQAVVPCLLFDGRNALDLGEMADLGFQ